MLGQKLRIAIIDDEADGIEVAKMELSDAGYEPVPIENPIPDINNLVDSLFGSVQGVFCDHRLNFGSNNNIFGAEIVAKLYDRKVAAILVTQFIEIDHDTTIRKWRDKIPVLLNRDETNSSLIKSGFEQCRRELAGELRSDRISYRSLIRVLQFSNVGREEVVEAIVPSWNPSHPIRLPMSIIPNAIRKAIKPGTRLLAKVNIGATKTEDLFFTDFELAPELTDDELA